MICQDLTEHKNLLCFSCTTVIEGQLLGVGTIISEEICVSYSLFLHRKGMRGIFRSENQDKHNTRETQVETFAPSQMTSVNFWQVKPSPWIGICYLGRLLYEAAQMQCMPPLPVLPQPACQPRQVHRVPQPRAVPQSTGTLRASSLQGRKARLH